MAWAEMSREERTERVKELLAVPGSTMRTIAKALGAADRTMVAGHIYRNREALGLPPADPRAADKKRIAMAACRPKVKREKRPRNKPRFSFKRECLDGESKTDFSWKREEVWQPLPGTAPVTLVDLGRGMCRWPIGEGVILFCGCSVVETATYCVHHSKIAYKPKPLKKEAAR